jgi:hypothetical protein
MHEDPSTKRNHNRRHHDRKTSNTIPQFGHAPPSSTQLHTLIAHHTSAGNIGPAAAAFHITLPKPAKHIYQIFDKRVIDE